MALIRDDYHLNERQGKVRCASADPFRISRVQVTIGKVRYDRQDNVCTLGSIGTL